MRLSHGTQESLARSAPLAVLLVGQGRHRELPGGGLGERACRLIGRGTFGGKAEESLLLHADERGGPRALLLWGMGRPRDVTATDFRRAGLGVVKRAAELGVDRVVIGAAGKLDFDAASLRAVGDGAMHAAYRYPRKKPKTKPPREVVLASSGVRGAAALVKATHAVGEGANLARELGDLPGNIATPTYLKKTAEKVCRSGRLRFKAYDKRALKRMKMGAILAVNQGSAEEPWLIEMDYAPPKATRTICIVGKGLTFDSGGISIKPSSGMEEMKYDMCGGAATIGLMRAVAATRPKDVRVIGIVGTTDNMSGSAAYKPGDVVTAGSGSTIEVVNTDAEGRVVLADALHLATGFEPDAIIDMATLTGAIVIGLGHETAGLFATDDRLAKRIEEAGERTGESVWRMPVTESHRKAIKSKWADVKNSAGRPAGSCTAAAFLFHFSNGVPHAHLDIAGVAWDNKSLEEHPDGASGFGVRLLHDAIGHW